MYRYIICYCPLTYDDSVIFTIFYFNLWSDFDFITYIKYIHLCYFRTQPIHCRQSNTFTDIFYWPTMTLLFVSFFILNCRRNLLFSQISILFICANSKHKFFAADKEIHYLRFLIIIINLQTSSSCYQTKHPLQYGSPF